MLNLGLAIFIGILAYLIQAMATIAHLDKHLWLLLGAGIAWVETVHARQ